MLIIFGGLPGSGKTSISRHLADKLKAVYLRIDSIENAINNSALSRWRIRSIMNQIEKGVNE